MRCCRDWNRASIAAALEGVVTPAKAFCGPSPGKHLTLWFQDEASFGQKGRTCHRWFIRAQRPSGSCDQRYTWTHLFAAVRPATGQGFALVLPSVSTPAMQVFLDRFSQGLDADEHAVLVLDQASWHVAGWHVAQALTVPTNVTLALRDPGPA